MNWSRRYANSKEMQDHFEKHVLAPARQLMQKTIEFNHDDESHEDPWNYASSEDMDKEIQGCKFCGNPEYLMWEHDQLFSPKTENNYSEAAKHYHIHNQHINGNDSVSNCFGCKHGKF